MRQPLLAGLLKKGAATFLGRVADDVVLLGCQQATGNVVKGLPEEAAAGSTGTSGGKVMT